MKRKRHQPSEPQESGRTVVTKRRRRRLRKLGLAALATSCIVTAYSPLSSSASEDPNFPGLPDQNSFRGEWQSPSATAMNEVARAKQWVAIVPLRLAAFNFGQITRYDHGCTGRLGDYKSRSSWRASLYLMAGAEGSPKPFGYIAPFRVNTVAFGSIPVTATVRLAQPRDDDNLPIGGEVTTETGTFCDGPYGPFANRPPGRTSDNQHIMSADARLKVFVEVLSLSIDGVDLNLRDGCRTAEPADVISTGRELYYWDPSVTDDDLPSKENIMTTDYFNLGTGGLLTGTVDVGTFENCHAGSGDEVSRLLNATVSGNGNRVTMRSEGSVVAGCVRTPENCRGILPEIPYPTE